MSASLKIRQLESKISELQTQHQLLLKEREQEIAALLSVIDLAHLDDKILVGGLLFLKEKIITQDSTGLGLVEAWRDAGEKFLRLHKPRTSSFHQSCAGEKQVGSRPQVVTKKTLASKSTHASQPTDQPPQEHSQSGEA